MVSTVSTSPVSLLPAQEIWIYFSWPRLSFDTEACSLAGLSAECLRSHHRLLRLFPYPAGIVQVPLFCLKIFCIQRNSVFAICLGCFRTSAAPVWMPDMEKSCTKPAVCADQLPALWEVLLHTQSGSQGSGMRRISPECVGHQSCEWRMDVSGGEYWSPKHMTAFKICIFPECQYC